MKPYLPVYLYNSVEDEWTYISGLQHKKEQKKRITLSNAYADCYLFANADRDPFVFVSPVTVSPPFLDYFVSLSGMHNKPVVIVPRAKTPFICENLITDKKALHELIAQAKKYAGIALYPYATSRQVYLLRQKLESLGVRVLLPESPCQQSFWTVTTYGSKNGFRQLIAAYNKGADKPILIPDGFIVSSPRQAIQKVRHFMQKGKRAVIKTSKGSGGHGTYIVDVSDNASPQAVGKHIESYFNHDGLWKNNPIVVEEYIKTNSSSSCRFPSIECYIDQKGRKSILYACNMLVTQQGNFFGMEVGKDALPAKVFSTMKKYASSIVSLYAANGYRGHFDVDMLYGTDKKLYVGESNTRNTGGTDTYKMALHLIGKKGINKLFVLSKFVDFPPSAPLPTFRQLLGLLAPLLYDRRTKKGLVITSEASLREGSVTYFIIAPSKKEAYLLEQKLLDAVTNYSSHL